MGRRAKVSLYRLFTVGEKHRYIPIVRRGRSWAPKIEPAGTPGSYDEPYRLPKLSGIWTFPSVSIPAVYSWKTRTTDSCQTQCPANWLEKCTRIVLISYGLVCTVTVSP